MPFPLILKYTVESVRCGIEQSTIEEEAVIGNVEKFGSLLIKLIVI